MPGVLALYGSGEFTDPMIKVDNYLLGLTRAPAVVILPTAAGREDHWQHWIDDGLRYYQSLGVEVNGLDVLDSRQANNPKYAKELEKYTYIVFSGGDPGHLLDTLKDSLVWQKVKELYELGATLVGSSAGAMVMGKMVWARVYQMEKDQIVRPWEPGLNLFDFGVMPHFNIMQSYSSDKKNFFYQNLPKDIKTVGIEENTAYIRQNNRWIKKGQGKVFDPIKESDL